jgi:ABC-type multidrug transport system ATPase subunit/ABC-type multidrug transport system permease subunit
VSFVGQLDVHAPYLTVKETFEFASACRNDISQIQTNKTLESLTIEGLGLKICEDTFVGNTNIRGVSGGQRRRVSVGEMMQGNNPVACCDEMSTGLDAAVTHDIVKSIVDYSRAAKTTRVISLLQPGPETFALFDEVVVLCEGMIAYSGPVEEAVDYFASLGYELPPTVDVADFLQTVTTAEGALLFEPKNSPRDEHYSATQFAEAFMESKYGSLIEQQLQAPPTNNWKELGVPKQYKNQFSNSWVRSFKLNFNRHLLLWWRDKGFIIGKTAENIGMSATTGGILFQQARIPSFASIWDSKNAEALQLLQDGINSALFMTCLHILLGTTTSAPQDLDERPIHYKHGDASFYQTSAYVLGKLAASLPQRILETVSFSIPLYFLVGLDSAPSSFFLFLTIVLVYTFTLKLLYAIFTQFAPNQQNVLSFGTFLVLLFALFSGFIVYPNVIPGYYYWFLYANPVFWAYQALLLTELTSSKYSPSAAKFLSARGFHYTRQWIGYSFAFFIPYALLCAVLFVFVLKTVRIEPIRSGISKDINNEEEKTNEREEFNFSFTKVDLTFEDIVYKVKASTGNEMLRLLNGVSGVFQGGRMCALM